MACLFQELQVTQQLLEQTAYKVYAKVVRETLYEVAQENCHGCRIDHPSQKQHDVCLFMSLEEKLDYFLDEALERVDLERATEKWNKALEELFPAQATSHIALYDYKSTNTELDRQKLIDHIIIIENAAEWD